MFRDYNNELYFSSDVWKNCKVSPATHRLFNLILCCHITNQFKVKSCIQTDIFRAIIFHAILFHLNWLGLAMKSNIYLKHYNFQMVSWRPIAETSHEIKQFPYTSHTVVRGKIDLIGTLFIAYRILNGYKRCLYFVYMYLFACSRFTISMRFMSHSRFYILLFRYVQ